MSGFFELAMILLAIGAFAGILAGLFGVGGGIILVPAFVSVFQSMGYNNPQLMQIAIATSLATIIATSIRSLLAHNKKGAVDWRILKSWAAPIAMGAVAAVFVARDLKTQSMMIIFGGFALIISIVMFFGLGRKVIAEQMPQGWKIWPWGLLTGFISTIMGIGGGSIAVPIMISHGRPIHQAVATAAGFGVMIAVPSVLVFMITQPPAEHLPPFQIGYVNLVAAFIVIIATMLTAPIGAKWAHQLPAQNLKRFFAVFIFIVALNMLRKALLL